MNGYYWAYASLVVALAGLEGYGIVMRPKPNDTITEFLGFIFRADTKVGWWVLILLFGAVAGWLPAHVRRFALERRARENAVKPPE